MYLLSQQDSIFLLADEDVAVTLQLEVKAVCFAIIILHRRNKNVTI